MKGEKHDVFFICCTRSGDLFNPQFYMSSAEELEQHIWKHLSSYIITRKRPCDAVGPPRILLLCVVLPLCKIFYTELFSATLVLIVLHGFSSPSFINRLHSLMNVF